MTTHIHKLAAAAVRTFSKSDMVHKPIEGFNKTLYYEASQHLTFLFKSKISYEPNVWRNISQYIKPGALVFDIGGNIGQYALRFSEIVGPSGKVISFEPDFKNFALLQFNANINYCKNVICQNIGLGDQPGELKFFRDTETGGRMGSFEPDFLAAKGEGATDVVKVRTYDEMTKVYGQPDFVKIDVEGFEVSVLKGIVQFHSATRFLIEVRKETKQPVFDLFRGQGFDCFAVDGAEPSRINQSAEIPDFADLLFVKPASASVPR